MINVPAFSDVSTQFTSDRSIEDTSHREFIDDATPEDDDAESMTWAEYEAADPKGAAAHDWQHFLDYAQELLIDLQDGGKTHKPLTVIDVLPLYTLAALIEQQHATAAPAVTIETFREHVEHLQQHVHEETAALIKRFIEYWDIDRGLYVASHTSR